MLQLSRPLPALWHRALTGAMLGDALGVPFEFMPGHEIPAKQDIQMVMPSGFVRSHPGVEYGTWSDDTSQMLALLDSLSRQEGRYDAQDMGQRLLAWLREGRYQAGGRVFDCGMQTRKSLEAFAAGQPFYPEDERICGNGALMRVLPVAALPDWWGVSTAQALQIAMLQSANTHPQLLSKVLCASYVALAWRAAKAPPHPGAWYSAAAAALREVAAQTADAEVLRVVGACLAYATHALPTGSGYVLNTFWSAIWAMNEATSLSDALRRAVSLGNDTDTVACVTGGLAGLCFEFDDTAEEWARICQQRAPWL